jgi:hypothetical protein
VSITVKNKRLTTCPHDVVNGDKNTQHPAAIQKRRRRPMSSVATRRPESQ